MCSLTNLLAVMKVLDLINLLSEYDLDLPVTIADPEFGLRELEEVRVTDAFKELGRNHPGHRSDYPDYLLVDGDGKHPLTKVVCLGPMDPALVK
jgi:hypothetical protein